MAATGAYRRPHPGPALAGLIGLAGLLLTLGTAACTATSDVVDEIGTTRLVIVDPGLASQSLADPDSTIQAAEWEVQVADLELGEAGAKDLLLGSTCSIADTAFASPATNGTCRAGIVIDSDEETAVPVILTLKVTMNVRRAEPLELPEDYDSDGVANAMDLCPLIPNPGQEDANLDGIGDVCSLALGTSSFLDSDADGVSDLFDNCAWKANPGQEDTSGIPEVYGENVKDAIGDACTEQRVDVKTGGGQALLELVLGPVDLLQPRNQLSFLTVDFNSDETGLNQCDWAAGSCAINLDAVTFCVHTSSTSVPFGCP